MSRTSGSIVGKDLADDATTGIFTVQQALTKKAAGNWPASSGWGQYEISRSLRFNSADSAYLSRTPASAGNRKTWTWSGWVKRGTLTGYQNLILSQNSTTYTYLNFYNTNTFEFGSYTSGTVNHLEVSNAVWRDTSAWMHIVASVDTTQATASNRIRIYVNGVQVAVTVSTQISQNADTHINSTIFHSIGSNQTPGNFFDGYMAEVYLVDGQALTPSDFGETDATTGVWKPKFYIGTYGTNGFYLNFSDNTSTTALGYDAAGSNDWTLNNFSVTAGAGNDSLVDTPTPYGEDTGVGGEVRGNYCTLNPLDVVTANGVDISNGNLTAILANANIKGTVAIPSSGKWYYELTVSKLFISAYGGSIGIVKAGTASWSGAFIIIPGWDDASAGIYKNASKVELVTGVSVNDVFGVAVNMDSLTLQIYRNNSAFGSALTIDSATYLPYMAGNGNNTGDASSGSVNFGQRPFAYTAPSGFKALCTQNLPDPTVVQGDDYFNTVLYTGNGSTQSITGVGFAPDFVWIKNRSSAVSHQLFDQIRGAEQKLSSDATTAEVNRPNALTSFDSDGFTTGSETNTNASGAAIVSWHWNAGGSNATNTDGTITSTVRANPTAGFSVVSYTGNGSTSPYPTVGHGLGVTPKLIITKTRSTTSNWVVYTTVIDGSLDFLYLNTTAAKSNSTLPSAPTSTVFQVGGADNNTNGATVIAYCFAEVEGYSKFGSYTGNGSADGPFVYCGFKPAFVLIKQTNTTRNWFIWDAVRSPYNPVSPWLVPNTSDAELATLNPWDFVSNGIKLRDTNASFNASGGTYIFMAFAENPFKYSLAR